MLIRRPSTCLTSSTGMAKPMPWAPARMATLTPTSSPSMLSSGPPELPGLIAASVWISALYDISLFSVTSRCNGADDADGDGVLVAVGVADGDDRLADHQVVGGAQRHDGQRLGGVDLDEGQVGLGVAGDDAGRVHGAVGQADAQRVHVLDDVVVGDDVAARVDDDAGAHAVHTTGGGNRPRHGRRCGAIFWLWMFTTDGRVFCTAVTTGVMRLLPGFGGAGFPHARQGEDHSNRCKWRRLHESPIRCLAGCRSVGV